MPLPPEIRDELALRHRGEHESAERDRRRDFTRTALICWGWALLGLAMVAYSVNTTDETIGRIAFYTGLGVGNAGMIFTLLGAYRRGEARGDW
jgi:hypothetical protein